jgi:hypothetical protein
MAYQHGPGTSDQAHHQHSGLGSCLRRRFHSLTGLFHRSTGYRHHHYPAVRQSTEAMLSSAQKFAWPVVRLSRCRVALSTAHVKQPDHQLGRNPESTATSVLRHSYLCRGGKCLCCHVHQQKGQANVSGWDCSEAPLRVTTVQPLFAAPGSPQASKLLVKLLRSKDWS